MPERQIKQEFLTKAAFSRLSGTSKPNITQLIKVGTLTENEDGLLDTWLPPNYEYLLGDEQRRQKVLGHKIGAGSAESPAAPGSDKARIDKGRADKLEIDNAKKRGELISFDLVEKFFNEFVIIDTKQLTNIAIRSAPNIISICEVSDSYQPQIVAEIKGEIYKIIETKKALLENFIKEHGNNKQ